MPPKAKDKPAKPAAKKASVKSAPKRALSPKWSVGDEVDANFNGEWFAAVVTQISIAKEVTYTVEWESDESETGGLPEPYLQPRGGKQRRTAAKPTAGSAKKTTTTPAADTTDNGPSWADFFATLVVSDYADEVNEGLPKKNIGAARIARAKEICAKLSDDDRTARGYTPELAMEAYDALEDALKKLRVAVSSRVAPDSDKGKALVAQLEALQEKSPAAGLPDVSDAWKDQRKVVEVRLKLYRAADELFERLKKGDRCDADPEEAGGGEGAPPPKKRARGAAAAVALYIESLLPAIKEEAAAAAEGDSLHGKADDEKALKAALKKRWDALPEDDPDRKGFAEASQAKQPKAGKRPPTAEECVAIVALQDVLLRAEGFIREDAAISSPDLQAFLRETAVQLAQMAGREKGGILFPLKEAAASSDVYELHKLVSDVEAKLRRAASIEAVVDTPAPEGDAAVTQFARFSMAKMEEIVADNPEMTKQAMRTKITSDWAAVSKNDRKLWHALAQRDAQRSREINKLATVLRKLPADVSDAIRSLHRDMTAAPPAADDAPADDAAATQTTTTTTSQQSAAETPDAPAAPAATSQPPVDEKMQGDGDAPADAAPAQPASANPDAAKADDEEESEEATFDEGPTPQVGPARAALLRRYNKEVVPGIVRCLPKGDLAAELRVRTLSSYEEAVKRVAAMREHLTGCLGRCPLAPEERLLLRRARDKRNKAALPVLRRLREDLFHRQFGRPAESDKPLVVDGVAALPQAMQDVVLEAFASAVGGPSWDPVMYAVRDLLDELEGNVPQPRVAAEATHVEYINTQIFALQRRKVKNFRGPDESVLGLPALPPPRLLPPSQQVFFADMVQCFLFVHVFAKCCKLTRFSLDHFSQALDHHAETPLLKAIYRGLLSRIEGEDPGRDWMDEALQLCGKETSLVEEDHEEEDEESEELEAIPSEVSDDTSEADESSEADDDSEDDDSEDGDEDEDEEEEEGEEGEEEEEEEDEEEDLSHLTDRQRERLIKQREAAVLREEKREEKEKKDALRREDQARKKLEKAKRDAEARRANRAVRRKEREAKIEELEKLREERAKQREEQRKREEEEAAKREEEGVPDPKDKDAEKHRSMLAAEEREKGLYLNAAIREAYDEAMEIEAERLKDWPYPIRLLVLKCLIRALMRSDAFSQAVKDLDRSANVAKSDLDTGEKSALQEQKKRIRKLREKYLESVGKRGQDPEKAKVDEKTQEAIDVVKEKYLDTLRGLRYDFWRDTCSNNLQLAPLGSDRHRRLYFKFPTHPAVFVFTPLVPEMPTLLPECSITQLREYRDAVAAKAAEHNAKVDVVVTAREEKQREKEAERARQAEAHAKEVAAEAARLEAEGLPPPRPVRKRKIDDDDDDNDDGDEDEPSKYTSIEDMVLHIPEWSALKGTWATYDIDVLMPLLSPDSLHENSLLMELRVINKHLKYEQENTGVNPYKSPCDVTKYYNKFTSSRHSILSDEDNIMPL